MHISPLMIVSAIVIGSLSSYLAYRRGRNPYGWFAIGFLFGILGVFAIFFAAGKKKAPMAADVKPEPIFYIDGPADKFWYYLDSMQKQLGPMSRDALTSAWKEGKVNLTTYVWHEEMADWKPLKETLRAE